MLLENGGIPGEEILQKVLNAVSADEKGVRPLTDYVKALPPNIVDYDVSVEYYISKDADVTATEKAAEAAVEAYVLWQKTRLGRDINPDELLYRLKSISGVKRARILSPSFVELDDRQVAIASNVRLTMMGSEDE